MSDSVTPGTAILNSYGSVNEILHFKVLESNNLAIERRPTDVSTVHKYDIVEDRTYVKGPINNPTELVCAMFNNAITVYGATNIPSAKNPNGTPILSQLAPTYEPVVGKKAAAKAQISSISNALAIAADSQGQYNYIYFHKDNAADSTRTVLCEYKRTVGSELPSFKNYPDWKQPLAKSRLAAVFEPFSSTRVVFYQTEGAPSNFITYGWTDNNASSKINITNGAMAGSPLAASIVPDRKGQGWFDIYLFYVDSANSLQMCTYTATKDSPAQWLGPTRVMAKGGVPITVGTTSDLFVVRHGTHNHVFYCNDESEGYQDIPVPFLG
ncbi:hypothetical protein CIB48_g4408 [Xylaria polymorpha]|nr:hypothetical protein CIB48_g4408 [Xylaria polymorpha]